jgi:hypothetical protein
MSDIRAVLAEQGLTAEEITALVGNEKNAKAMSALLAKYDEGVGLSAKAKSELEAANAAKLEAHDFYENTVTPAISKKSGELIDVKTKAAKMAARYIELHKEGFEVPADVLADAREFLGLPATGGATVTPSRDPQTGAFTRADFDKEMQGTASAQIALAAITQRYQHLYGEPYLTMEEDYAEAQRARKPLREYVATKYKFEEKTAEKKAAAEQVRIDAIVKEKVDAERAKLTAQYGSNPETRAPLASKFDKIEKSRESQGKDTWKSAKARDEARKNRLSKFENVVM